MSRGWDIRGARDQDRSGWRVVCGSPPGVQGFRPNVFCGLFPADDTPPEVAVGVADFSIELWFCQRRYGYTTAPDAVCVSGMLKPFGDFRWEGGAIRWGSGTGLTCQGRYDDVPGVAPPFIQTANCYLAPGWNHCVANFDRSGNLDVYTNGMLRNSVAINALDMGNARIYAYAIEWAGAGAWAATEWATPEYTMGVVGPFAAHRRLMTVDEIEDAYWGKRVQNFGAAGSFVVWDWRLIEGVTAWEFDTSKIVPKTREALTLAGIGAPIGANGTVIVPDLSGSGNHWTLPTDTSYTDSNVALARSQTAFLSDPFWRS